MRILANATGVFQDPDAYATERYLLTDSHAEFPMHCTGSPRWQRVTEVLTSLRILVSADRFMALQNEATNADLTVASLAVT